MTKRRTLLVLFALLPAIGMLAPGASLGAEKIRIGILLSSGEARYTDTAEGAIKQLKAEGYDESRVTVETQDAKGDKVAAAKIAKQFAADGVRLVMPMGTAAATGAVKELKDIPIVFGMVYDPVEAGFARSWTSSGTNTTGSSNKIPMAAVVKTLKRLGSLKRLGVLYNPTEKNSVLQLEDLKATQRDLAFDVVEIPIPKAEEAAAAARAFASRVDAFYITGAVAVTSQMAAIMAVAVDRKLPTISHLIDVVEVGALLGVTANAQEVGKLAGARAAQILRGTRPSDIPIGTLKKFDVTINLKTATAMGLKVPVDLLQSASRVIR